MGGGRWGIDGSLSTTCSSENPAETRAVLVHSPRKVITIGASLRAVACRGNGIIRQGLR